MKSRMRESCTYGFGRGVYGDIDFYSIFHINAFRQRIFKILFNRNRKRTRESSIIFKSKNTYFFNKARTKFYGVSFYVKRKKLIVLLNNQTRKRITKKLNALSKKKKDEHYRSVLASYHGYFLNADCKAFLKRHGWYEEEKQ